MNIAIYQINPDRDENNVAFLNYENNGADDAANDARTTDYWRFLSAARPPYHPSSA